MDREDIFTSLREAEPQLRDRGVQSLAVFGSVARGNYSQDSDLDILVDFSRPVGLFEFIRLKQYLEKITQRRVDLVTQDALRPEMKNRILKEAVHVR
jgi:predicted nucleotidyltransferase